MAKTALCIGINYAGTDAALNGCINDMTDWAGLLQHRGHTVRTLEEAEATRSNILEHLAEALGAAGPGGLCVVTYSGHGSYMADPEGDEPDGRDELWVPHDYATGAVVSDDDLYETIRARANGARVVILSDSCHSGTMSKLAAKSLAKDAIPERATRVRFLPPAHFLKGAALARALGVKGRPRLTPRPDLALLISGCQDTEYSYDAWYGDRANGAFTYNALHTLRELPAGATYENWWNAIRKHLPSVAFPQTPNLLGSGAQRAWLALE